MLYLTHAHLVPRLVMTQTVDETLSTELCLALSDCCLTKYMFSLNQNVGNGSIVYVWQNTGSRELSLSRRVDGVLWPMAVLLKVLLSLGVSSLPWLGFVQIYLEGNDTVCSEWSTSFLFLKNNAIINSKIIFSHHLRTWHLVILFNNFNTITLMLKFCRKGHIFQYPIKYFKE